MVSDVPAPCVGAYKLPVNVPVPVTASAPVTVAAPPTVNVPEVVTEISVASPVAPSRFNTLVLVPLMLA